MAEAAAAVPPVPNYQPPLPPSSSASGQRLAEQQTRNAGAAGADDNAPDRILRTTVPSPASSSKAGHGPNGSSVERRETTVLPVVEEAAEGTSMGDRSRNSHLSSLTTESDGRPLTPAKDGYEREPGFGNPLLGSRSGSGSKARPPPTPPKTGRGYGGQPKPESADSGYGVGANGSSNSGLKSLTGSQKSLNIRSQLSRDSLDKALPPLPNASSAHPQDVS
jgi:1-phosphatidylinositol-4-phosphate 5-kinase